MSQHKAVIVKHDNPGGTVRSYTTGFILSIALTLIAYVLAVHAVVSGWALVYALAALALTQLVVQLLFFLHAGRESRPRWNLTVMLFALLVVFILVFGSLWIMKNLQYNHHHGAPANESDKFIIHDEGYNQ